MVNPLTQALKVTVFETPDEAISKGYNYRADRPEMKPIELQEVVVVRNGTVAGNASVDFIVKDDEGQEYVFMVTRKLLASIPT